VTARDARQAPEAVLAGSAPPLTRYGRRYGRTLGFGLARGACRPLRVPDRQRELMHQLTRLRESTTPAGSRVDQRHRRAQFAERLRGGPLCPLLCGRSMCGIRSADVAASTAWCVATLRATYAYWARRPSAVAADSAITPPVSSVAAPAPIASSTLDSLCWRISVNRPLLILRGQSGPP
jgi:hypothetical protein